MTVQEILDIACRHYTAIAEATIAACLAWSAESGVALAFPEREAPAASVARTDASQPGRKWQELVERNSDTRWNHV